MKVKGYVQKGDSFLHRKRKNFFLRDRIFYWLLLLLPLLQVGIFYFGVNVQSIFMAFKSYDVVSNTFSWGMESNLLKLKSDFTSSQFWVTVGNSFLVWIVTSLSVLIFAVLFAYYIYKRHSGSTFFRIILFLPSMLPVTLLVLIFKGFAGEGYSAFYQFFTGVPKVNVFSEMSTTRFWVITLFSITISYGAQVMVYTGAMDQIPEEIIEAGQIDGVSAYREFVSIILPSIFSSVGTFLIVSVASIFTNQNNLFYFVDGYMKNTLPSERTIGYYMYCLIYESGSMDNYCYASLLGVLCTIVVLPLTMLVRKIINKVED